MVDEQDSPPKCPPIVKSPLSNFAPISHPWPLIGAMKGLQGAFWLGKRMKGLRGTQAGKAKGDDLFSSDLSGVHIP